MDFRKGKLDQNLVIKSYDQSEDALVKEVEVKKGDQTIFSYSTTEIGQVLVKSGLVQPVGKGPLLVTVWAKGAHSEVMMVHDLNLQGSVAEKEILRCRITSAWPMAIDPDEKRIIAYTKGDEVDSKTGVPKTVVKTCEF